MTEERSGCGRERGAFQETAVESLAATHPKQPQGARPHRPLIVTGLSGLARRRSAAIGL